MGFALSHLRLTSPAFSDGARIPTRYAAEGDNVSPPLEWGGLPENTGGLAVICHDPDAPLVVPHGAYGFVHWTLYNLPGALGALPEAVAGYTNGQTDYGRAGYGGPNPPPGHGIHRYYFWLLALDRETELEPGLTLWTLLARLEPHILGMNRLVGTYQR